MGRVDALSLINLVSKIDGAGYLRVRVICRIRSRQRTVWIEFSNVTFQTLVNYEDTDAILLLLALQQEP